MPRLLQHGVWSMLLARHANVMLAQGAQTIRSGTSVKSALTGSHILSRQVRCVMPFFMQHPRTSGSTGTTATLVCLVAAPPSSVSARIRVLGRLEP
uniref:Putative secreted protein n=1 Tax=Anopheles darlingi TaxID=43151 RepID=A0A2M4DQW4_ANODA